MTEPTAPLITSTQNPKIKRLLALQEKSSERRKSGLFVVEGRRELQHCIAAGYEVESVFVRPLSNSPRGGESRTADVFQCEVLGFNDGNDAFSGASIGDALIDVRRDGEDVP